MRRGNHHKPIKTNGSICVNANNTSTRRREKSGSHKNYRSAYTKQRSKKKNRSSQKMHFEMAYCKPTSIRKHRLFSFLRSFVLPPHTHTYARSRATSTYGFGPAILVFATTVLFCTAETNEIHFSVEYTSVSYFISFIC